MKTLRFSQFLAISFLLFAFTSCNNSGPDNLTDSLPTKTVLSSTKNQTYFHYAGTGNTARAVHILRNSDGSASITRMDVPLSMINESVDFVALDGDSYDPNTHSVDYQSSSIPLWYIPFGNDPIEQMGIDGQTAVASCNCKSFSGFCMVMNGPDDYDGAKWTFCAASNDCYAGCNAFTSFSVSGVRPAGITLKATQASFQ